jgi:hypothetical protein
MIFSKIKEIAEAWIISANPSPIQKKRAEERYSICLDCEHFGKSRSITGDEYCKDCLCPLDKKIFSQKKEHACPLNKWKEVDEKFNSMVKDTKTLL